MSTKVKLPRKGARMVLSTLTLLCGAAILPAAVAKATPGVPGNGKVSWGSSYSVANGWSMALDVSDDGRFAAYASNAPNILPAAAASGAYIDVYRYDRLLGITLLMSTTPSGTAGNAGSTPHTSAGRRITPDGRFVVFNSKASNLVPGDTNGKNDIFLRDTNGWGSTERVSLGPGGTQLNADSFEESVSSNGNRISFNTSAALSALDSNGTTDVYVYDRTSKTAICASCRGDGVAFSGNNGSISRNGEYVVFASYGAGVTSDRNNVEDIYVKSLSNGVLVAVTNGNANSNLPAFGGSPLKVVFNSLASNLVPNDTNGVSDVFSWSFGAPSVTRISTAPGVPQANGGCYIPTVDLAGRYVAMRCAATNLVPGYSGVLVKDTTTGSVTHVSRTQAGYSFVTLGTAPTISGDGNWVLFSSRDANIVTPDTNGDHDAFISARQ